MNKFISCANEISARKSWHYSSSQIKEELDDFQIWKDSRNKHDVDDFS